MRIGLTQRHHKASIRKARKKQLLLPWLFLIPLLGLIVIFILPVGPRESIILFVDRSSSMSEEFTAGLGDTKMQVAKQAALQVIDELPPSVPIMLIAFADGNCPGSGVDWIIQQPQENLGGVIYPLSQTDRSQLIQNIQELEPSGNTHLSEALWKTILFLQQESTNQHYRFIVIGDGNDHCNAIEIGNTVLNHAQGLQFKIDVIGLDLADHERENLETLAFEGRGMYYSATDPTSFLAALKATTHGLGHDYWPLIVTAIIIGVVFLGALVSRNLA